MPSLNVDLDYFTHPKTVRLVGLLGKGSEVLPIRLWCYCGKYHMESGKLTGYSAQEIESVVGWWGKEGEFISAMIKVGMLEAMPGAYKVHDWEENQGHLYSYKEKAKVAAKARWGKAKGANKATINAPSMLQALLEPCTSNALSVQCSTSSKDLTTTTCSPPGEPAVRFEDFYDNYPRKEARADALKAWGSCWKKALLTKQSWEEKVRPALLQQCAEKWAGKEKQFIPLPATWLRGQRWNDEIELKQEAPHWSEIQLPSTTK